MDHSRCLAVRVSLSWHLFLSGPLSSDACFFRPISFLGAICSDLSCCPFFLTAIAADIPFSWRFFPMTPVHIFFLTSLYLPSVLPNRPSCTSRVTDLFSISRVNVLEILESTKSTLLVGSCVLVFFCGEDYKFSLGGAGRTALHTLCYRCRVSRKAS